MEALLQPLADQPVVPERVDDTPLPHPVRLIRDSEQLLRSCLDRAGAGRVGIVHFEGDANRRRPNRLGARCSEIRGFGRDAEPSAGDPEKRHLGTVRRDDSLAFFDRAECPSVELDGRGNVSFGQERKELRYEADASAQGETLRAQGSVSQ